jgi:hypothetical protein
MVLRRLLPHAGGARFRGGSQIEATAALIGSPAGIVEFANTVVSGVTIGAFAVTMTTHDVDCPIEISTRIAGGNRAIQVPISLDVLFRAA